MRLSGILLGLFRLLVPFALAATLYIYLYPAFKQCSFPEAHNSSPNTHHDAASTSGHKAPFRLLALADPQLEGDTSLPSSDSPAFPNFERLLKDVEKDGLGVLSTSWRSRIEDLLHEDIVRTIRGYRKRLDLWGNDRYLAHIYRAMHWWSDPTHIVVLGDLLGSQWIDDEEFSSRTRRFWNTVFKSGHVVPREITDANEYHAEVLGQDPTWKNRIIAVAGNHDIGYAGDITLERMPRFEDAYGRVNWEVRFALNKLPAAPELRLVILNSMNLDGPAYEQDLQAESMEFLDRHLHNGDLPPSTATILLTHIPLYKEEGVCVDGPFFDHFPEGNGRGIKEQNHLSSATSERILEGLTGPNGNGSAIVLNGHDHEGCLVYHARPKAGMEIINEQTPIWAAYEYHSPEGALARHPSRTGVREVTVRSMMGDFGGNAGLVSAWWDETAGQWRFEYADCLFGVQHIWWAVHVFDVVAACIGLLGALAWVIESASRRQTTDIRKKNV
ncbi:unnamed protein product [Zymoseptoria tritici ST99CH_3D7]|uniref:Calcineurin-like phosphoesterase domain-containing protein n=1 Tax=Zymoseptoria tritici (strain ST99CH_3D7) TaxID=1276538 RepID=A0A1X7RCA2_ZYMT9|nr:unnamed protein product [Zymoseptoria tritici ST99CH_3D7]